jgi:hypothetical protein
MYNILEMNFNMLIILIVILVIIGIFYSKDNQLSLRKFIINNNNNIENFTCDDSSTEEESYQSTLTQSQINQIKQLTNDQAMQLMNSSSSLMQGPSGGSGPQGPPGGEFQAAGRMVNQSVSYKNRKSNAFLPSMVTTRTSGTLPTQSLCLMDNPTLGSFQYWYLNKNGTIENKYDNTCINYNPTKSTGTKVYMGDCNPSDYNQWAWDKDNRILFKNGDNQCLSISNPESGISTTTIPGCGSKDDDCLRTGNRRYLNVKTYESGQLYDDEIWSFI